LLESDARSRSKRGMVRMVRMVRRRTRRVQGWWEETSAGRDCPWHKPLQANARPQAHTLCDLPHPNPPLFPHSSPLSDCLTHASQAMVQAKHLRQTGVGPLVDLTKIQLQPHQPSAISSKLLRSRCFDFPSPCRSSTKVSLTASSITSPTDKCHPGTSLRT
jgi:hypothetical protein